MIFVHQGLKKSFSECQNMAGTNSGVSDGSMDGGKGIPSEASRMLEAALQQMDGIIQGAKFELPQFDNFSLQVLFFMVDCNFGVNQLKWSSFAMKNRLYIVFFSSYFIRISRCNVMLAEMFWSCAETYALRTIIRLIIDHNHRFYAFRSFNLTCQFTWCINFF